MMPSRNTHVRYDAVPYGEVSDLRTSGQTPASAIVRHEAAFDALQRADSDEIVAAAPTGMATGVHLASMPLTIIRLEAVPNAVLSGIDREGRPISEYKLLVFGQVPDRENHSLRQFA